MGEKEDPSWEEEVFGGEEEEEEEGGGVVDVGLDLGAVGEGGEFVSARRSLWARMTQPRTFDEMRGLYRGWWGAKQALALLPLFTFWHFAVELRNGATLRAPMVEVFQKSMLTGARVRWVPFLAGAMLFYPLEFTCRLLQASHWNPAILAEFVEESGSEGEVGKEEVKMGGGREEGMVGGGGEEGNGGREGVKGVLEKARLEEFEALRREVEEEEAEEEVLERVARGGLSAKELEKRIRHMTARHVNYPAPSTTSHAIAGASTGLILSAIFFKRAKSALGPKAWRVPLVAAGAGLVGAPLLPAFESIRVLDLLPVNEIEK